ncbi:hypothetical protein WJX74_007729 [Apatococcus lobatus]|uniref:Uncharacterized protein n=1 Tax=Apatococcus lobatus TaxID=904363 RepID=A0AAW1QDH4_9CHLO
MGGKNMKKQWLKMYLKEQEQQEERQKLSPAPAEPGSFKSASDMQSTSAAKPGPQATASEAPASSKAASFEAVDVHPSLLPPSQHLSAQPWAPMQMDASGPSQSTPALLGMSAAPAVTSGKANESGCQAQPKRAQRDATVQHLTPTVASPAAPDAGAASFFGSKATASHRHQTGKGLASAEPASSKARCAQAAAEAKPAANHVAGGGQSKPMRMSASEPLAAAVAPSAMPAGAATDATHAASHGLKSSLFVPSLGAAPVTAAAQTTSAAGVADGAKHGISMPVSALAMAENNVAAAEATCHGKVHMPPATRETPQQPSRPGSNQAVGDVDTAEASYIPPSVPVLVTSPPTSLATAVESSDASLNEPKLSAADKAPLSAPPATAVKKSTVLSSGGSGSAASFADKASLPSTLSDGRNEANAVVPARDHSAQATAGKAAAEGPASLTSQEELLVPQSALPAAAKETPPNRAAEAAASASIRLKGPAEMKQIPASASMYDSKSDDGPLPPHMMLKKTRKSDAVSSMSSPAKPAAPLQGHFVGSLNDKAAQHAPSTDFRHNNAWASKSAVGSTSQPLALPQADRGQEHANQPAVSKGGDGPARQAKRRRSDDCEKVPGSSESDKSGLQSGRSALGRQDKQPSEPGTKGRVLALIDADKLPALKKPARTEPGSTMASKSSSPSEAQAGKAGRLSGAAQIGNQGRLSGEPKASSPHTHAAAHIQPGLSRDDKARRSSGSDDPASKLAGALDKKGIRGPSAPHSLQKAPGKPQKGQTGALRPGVEKASSKKATPHPAGESRASQSPASRLAAPDGQRPAAQSAAATEGRSIERVLAAVHEKPQGRAIPDVARKGGTESKSNGSQPAIAKLKSVPTEASGAFKAPGKPTLLALATKHESSDAKRQSKAVDKAGLSRPRPDVKPPAGPASLAQPLKKHKPSSNSPHVDAAAVGQPPATSAQPHQTLSTKPSHKRKAQPDDAAATPSRADAAGGTSSAPQQQQHKRPKSMPYGKGPAASGSRSKPQGLSDAKLSVPKPLPSKQPSVKFFTHSTNPQGGIPSQALPNPKPQQKRPLEALQGGGAAGSHTNERVAAQEMVATSDPHANEPQTDAAGKGEAKRKVLTSSSQNPAASNIPAVQQKGDLSRKLPTSPFQEAAGGSFSGCKLDPHTSRPARDSQQMPVSHKPSAAKQNGPEGNNALTGKASDGGPEGQAAKDKAHASSRGIDGIPADFYSSFGRSQRQPLGIIDMVLFENCRQLHAALRDRAHLPAELQTSLLFQDTQQDLIQAGTGQPWGSIVASACHLIIKCK